MALALGTLVAPAPASAQAMHQEDPPMTHAGWVESCQDWDEWTAPGPLFQITQEVFYVGTCGIAAILVRGEHGHILIDTGPEAAADLVAANVERLGIDLTDIALILHSHEHFDHVGGMAKLQRLTGARIIASEAAAPVIRSGQPSPDDPQFGELEAFEPAPVDGIVTPGVTVTLGNLRLTPIATPGHTEGALSWSIATCIGHNCSSLVYADSLSAISREGYRFSDHPDLVASFRAGIDALAQRRCLALITPHPSASNMRERLAGREKLFDRQGCAAYAADRLARLEARLSEELAQ